MTQAGQSLWLRWKKVSLPNKLTVGCTVAIAIATILYTAFAYGQWNTMAKQLEEMKGGSTQADQLIRETHNLADNAGKQAVNASEEVKKLDALVLATSKQAAATHDQLSIMQRQLHATQDQLNASSNALIVQERPWIKITPRIVSPLTFDVGGRQGGPVALMSVENTLENVGQTVAVNVVSWEDVLPIDLDNSLRTALKRRSEWCDANRYPPQENVGFLSFPHDPHVQLADVGPTMATIKAFTVHETQSPPDSVDGTVGFVLVGCVCYRSSFEPKTSATHQTRYLYFLGKPMMPGFLPNIIPRGVASDLRLIEAPFYFIAD